MGFMHEIDGSTTECMKKGKTIAEDTMSPGYLSTRELMTPNGMILQGADE